MSEKRPHILFIMADQFRHDGLGCAGVHPMRTPNLDRLAAEGVRFVNAFTCSPLCMPARASLVSGLYPHNHCVWVNAGHLPADDETFVQHLRDVGYHTAAIGKMHFHSQGPGEHLRNYEDYLRKRGFETTLETCGPWMSEYVGSWLTDRWEQLGLWSKYQSDYRHRRKQPPWFVKPSPLGAEEHLDACIGRRAVEWTMQYDDSRPVFLWVSFGGPHEPWDAPEPYASMYDPGQIDPGIRHKPPTEEFLAVSTAKRLKHRPFAEMTIEDIQRLRANYFGKISLIDHWVGRIFQAWRKRGWLDDALVVFSSDHGEMAGDHHLLHKVVWYESSIRIPLLMRFGRRGPAGQTCSALVELTDLFATFVEAGRAKSTERNSSCSLLPLLAEPQRGFRDCILSEVDGKFMIRTQQYKYAIDETAQGYILIDLQHDPNELHNLINRPQFRSVQAQMREMLIERIVSAHPYQTGGAGPTVP